MNALGAALDPEQFDPFFGDQGVLVHRTPDILVLERLMKAFNAPNGLRMMTPGTQMHKPTAGDIRAEALGDHVVRKIPLADPSRN